MKPKFVTTIVDLSPQWSSSMTAHEAGLTAASVVRYRLHGKLSRGEAQRWLEALAKACPEWAASLKDTDT